MGGKRRASAARVSGMFDKCVDWDAACVGGREGGMEDLLAFVLSYLLFSQINRVEALGKGREEGRKTRRVDRGEKERESQSPAEGSKFDTHTDGRETRTSTCIAWACVQYKVFGPQTRAALKVEETGETRI